MGVAWTNKYEQWGEEGGEAQGCHYCDRPPYIYARVQVFHFREHDGLVVPLCAVFLGQEVHLPLLLLPVQQGWGLGTEVMKLGKVIRIHC